MPHDLLTPRQRLHPLSPGELKLFARDRAACCAWLGLAEGETIVPETLREEYAQALPVCFSKVEKSPDEFRWWTAWLLILSADNRWIGATGFAGPPNERGHVYLGFWIDDRYQKKGYMTEALAALGRWVFEQPRARSIGANTPADNIASQRVLEKNGFKREGEYEGHPYFVLTKAAG
jgi:[ribosomal protein S5]-alanine N-acetyltransferase